jgi:tetratricopeptide (TPR) repeat protein
LSAVSRPSLTVAIDRFARLPQRSNELWQGGIVSLPAWVVDEDDPEAVPTRPLAAVWVSRRTGLLHIAEIDERDTPTPEHALRALLDFGVDEARQLEGRPATIEVDDGPLREALAAALEPLGATVTLVDDLPLIRDAMRTYEIEEYGDHRPDLLDVREMSVEQVRAFAEAAALFHRSLPWLRFPDDELIVVDVPGAPRGMTHVVVTGSNDPPIGLAFFASRREFERVIDEDGDADAEEEPRPGYALTFGPVDGLSFGDVDAWSEHGFAVDGPLGYPFATVVDDEGETRRPSPAELAHLEALLRALATSADEDIDRGRWQETVDTAAGAVTLTLSLPALLEAIAGPTRRPPAPGAPEALARARQLMEEVREAGGRLPITRARQAVALSEDCAEAWLVLGDIAPSEDAAIEIYGKAMVAARRGLGDRFDAETGRFGADADTRLYLDAQYALARAFDSAQRLPEAVEAYRELLRLDGDDELGVRYLLVSLFIDQERDDDARALLREYPDDRHPIFAYGRALVLFRRDGDSAEARAALADAVRLNRHVTPYLLDPDALPAEPLAGSAPSPKSEAAEVWWTLGSAFEATPGALDWLRAQSPRDRPPRRHRPRRR